MKLDLLLKRESFEEVFSKTLAKYLLSQEGWEGTIDWGLFQEDSLNLIVNKHINLIYPSKIPSKEIKFLAKEYAYHSNLIIRLIQKFYIFLCLSRFFRFQLASNVLSIKPRPNKFSDICILPGNHSIRVVDLKANQCVVLSKSGYELNKIKNTIWLRTRFANIPGPKMIDWNIDEGWYVEQRIFGLPLNRHPDDKIIANTLEVAREFLCSMHQASSELVTIKTWTSIKFKQIDKAVMLLPECYSSHSREILNKVLFKLKNLSQRYVNTDLMIETSITHGDFQAANILIPVNSDNVYIIDWEYGGVRCRHYDSFVYNLDVRSPIGLGARIDTLISQPENIEQLKNWCDLQPNINDDCSLLVFMFFLDEIIFRLDDTMVPNLREPSQGFLTFLKEINYTSIMEDPSIHEG